MRINFLLLICSLLISGCNLNPEKVMNEQEKYEIIKEVNDRVTEYVAAMKKLDVNKMLTFYTDTQDFVLAVDGSLLIGYDKFSVRQRTKTLKIKSVNKIDVKNIHVYVLSKNAASCSYQFEWSMTRKTGDTIKSTGSWNYVFKKTDNEWKIIHSTGTHIYE